ncbi:MAG: flagellar biosynthesis anti-sigma factor FlgM [Myxococcales bacterium]|nr:flagellar biosynthesis anti-sigma factor FlgM [Myxococcales bacterium]
MRIPAKKGFERTVSADQAATVAPKGKDPTLARAGSGATGARPATSAVSAQARTLAAEHGIDIARVEQLRELIHSGEFKMDFMRIAERIVETGG